MIITLLCFIIFISMCSIYTILVRSDLVGECLHDPYVGRFALLFLFVVIVIGKLEGWLEIIVVLRLLCRA